mmetsp:Transcript_1371/g.2393  ORF Transcript_1371/g.2393 Transcript_1371/m.2393 type:complete len:136 (-) Transcript_1371:64-471(-)
MLLYIGAPPFYLNCFHILPGALGRSACAAVPSSWSSSPLSIPSRCNFFISCASMAEVGGADSSWRPLILSLSAKKGMYMQLTPTTVMVPATANETNLLPDTRDAMMLIKFQEGRTDAGGVDQRMKERTALSPALL